MKNYRNKINYLIFMTFAVVFIASVVSCTQGVKTPKYIFYFIGDGMGHAHVQATETYLAAIENRVGTKKLYMNGAPVQTGITTFSANKYITDSAAAGTALATGKKTNNGVISMNAKGKQSYKTVAEAARDKGMKVGILSTVYLNHATPASFYAHQKSRNMYYEIGMELPKSNFNFFAGGDISKAKGSKKDKPSVIDAAKKAGYKYLRNNKEILALKKGDDKIIAVPAECEEGHAMPYEVDKDGDDLTLAQLVEKGIEVLDNDKGFFMMVEGGKIDWASHANDIAAAVGEVIDFDNSVAVALEFYKKHPKETLIIVTADHETGGLSVGTSKKGPKWNFANLKEIQSSIEIAINSVKPLLNDTKVSDKEVYNKLIAAIGLNKESVSLTTNEKEELMYSIKYKRTKAEKVKSYMKQNKKNSPIKLILSEIVMRKTQFAWASGSHTAIAVPLKVFGDKASDFSGYKDNTDIPKILFDYISKQ
jgi:alkaline phosphatase